MTEMEKRTSAKDALRSEKAVVMEGREFYTAEAFAAKMLC